MKFNPKKYDPLIKSAVAHYWKTLDGQSKKQSRDNSDKGGRKAVTGGKQMDGFCHVINQLLIDCGLQNAEIFLSKNLELPGYFRPTKNWDMLIISESKLVAALEFKSQKGPSFGNNFNNRTEEAIGTSHDLWVAYREGAFGKDVARPWLGWVMLLEDCEGTSTPVKVNEPHFKVFPEFKNATYAKRYEILLSKLLSEKLYDSAALLLSSEKKGKAGLFSEPNQLLTMHTLLAGLAGHVGVFLASKAKK